MVVSAVRVRAIFIAIQTLVAISSILGVLSPPRILECEGPDVGDLPGQISRSKSVGATTTRLVASGGRCRGEVAIIILL